MFRTMLVALTLILASCAQHESTVPAPGALNTQTENPNRYLAYEHSIGIEAEGDKVAMLFEETQSICLQAVDAACTILDARLTRGDSAGASMRFRARSDGIGKLVAALSAGGKVASQSTSSEDLQGPIEDSAKKIAMLTAYRGQLEALRARSNADLDSLMRLTRELAEVQAQIEAQSGSQAHLTRRVQTEILNVTIYSHASQSFWRPTAEAISDFAGNLSEALALLVTVIAFLLPWGAVAVLCIWLTGLWRRRKRRLGNA